MPPANLVTDQTTFISPIGIGFTLAMCALLLGLPRRYALVPIIVLTCFMTMGERVMIVGLNFPMVRILMLTGWARVIVRGEMRIGKLNAVDKALIVFTISSLITYTLLWGTSEAFVNRCGMAYNVLGSYFLFRFLVRDVDDLVRVIKIAAVFIIPLAGSMVIEKMTGRNSFAMFGGVPAITAIRDGVLRCQGPFAHPILAGTFGATLFPLFAGLWRQGSSARSLSVAAILSSGVITFTSASSGPLVALLAGLIALLLWPLRRHMRVIRWGLLLALVGLEIVMKAHIWFLIARSGIVSGSTSHYRAYLIDRAIENFGGWWLIGTKSTGAWADADLGLGDRTNQYIVYGADGGLITLVLFVLVIACCFRTLGLTLHALREESPQLQFSVWALGAALFSHAVNFLSVSYFDQNFVNWYLLLAMISTASLSVHGVRRKVPVRDGSLHISQGARPALWESNLYTAIDRRPANKRG